MTRLYIVRHGQTEWSKNGKHTSVTDLPLTTDGEAEARTVAAALDPAEFGLVLSSPRQRARKTAELAGFVGDHSPEIVEDLVEWAYGDYEGRTSDEIQAEVPDWTIWTHPALGGETPEQISARMARVVALVRDSGVEQVICFAHGHILRALTMTWLQLDLSFGGHFPLDTGTVSILGEAKDLPALEQWNA